MFFGRSRDNTSLLPQLLTTFIPVIFTPLIKLLYSHLKITILKLWRVSTGFPCIQRNHCHQNSNHCLSRFLSILHHSLSRLMPEVPLPLTVRMNFNNFSGTSEVTSNSKRKRNQTARLIIKFHSVTPCSLYKRHKRWVL